MIVGEGASGSPAALIARFPPFRSIWKGGPKTFKSIVNLESASGLQCDTMALDIPGIVGRALEGAGASEEEALAMLDLEGEDLDALLKAAGRVARRFRGDEVSLCTIINAKSGRCSEDCRFCAQSGHYGTDSETFPLMSGDEIYDASAKMDADGVDRFSIVTSGRGITSDAEFDTILGAVRRIAGGTGLEVCASLGVLPREKLRALRDAGLAYYHHNIETAPSFYPKICTTHPVGERMRTIRDARSAGLKVCSGGIIGLGESWEQRVEMALVLRELDPDSIPLNVLNPVTGTPLEDRPLTPPEDVLRTIAIFRMVNPTKSVRYAGGRQVNMGGKQALGLEYGLDGMLTGNYLTTTGTDPETDKSMIRGLGLKTRRE